MVRSFFLSDLAAFAGARLCAAFHRSTAMTSKHLIIVVSLVTAALTGSAFSQQDDKLGKVSFPTSCDPKVQADFERGVAMLHSYWFIYARKTFEQVLHQDPNCAMAHWGVAMDLLGNTLATPPSRANAEAASAALEKARAIGAKTQRERDWIEALSAYYRDHDKVSAIAFARWESRRSSLPRDHPGRTPTPSVSSVRSAMNAWITLSSSTSVTCAASCRAIFNIIMT
jgi:hypothetical protein